MKSDGVEDILKWLEEKCKEAKIDSVQMDVERAETRLATLVEIKIGVEKYMKKLRHNGQ